MSYIKGTDYFDMWLSDKKSMIDTMVRNMVSDIDAGYSYFGACVTKQKADIDAYKSEYEHQLDAMVEWTNYKTQRWCYTDMLKRGVISE